MFWSGAEPAVQRRAKKMEARLAEEGYVGYIDLNCIVNGNGIYPREHAALWQSEDQHPAGRHDNADRSVPGGLGGKESIQN